MKKFSIFMFPVLILVILYGCSKDHKAPTFATFDKLSEPSDVIASYSSSGDEINVSWTMADTAGVRDFLIAWSDSNVFDDGYVYDDEYMNPGNADLSFEVDLDADYVLRKMDYIEEKYYDVNNEAYIDSFIVYFTVSAVYNNEEFNYFIGERAIIDSALILR